MLTLKNRINFLFDPLISGLLLGALIAFASFTITNSNMASPATAEAIRAAVIECPELKLQILDLREPISKNELKSAVKACLQLRVQKAAIQGA